MENQNKYNAFSLLQFMWKWRKWLLIVCGAAFFVSAACSFLVRPRFKSTAMKPYDHRTVFSAFGVVDVQFQTFLCIGIVLLSIADVIDLLVRLCTNAESYKAKEQ